MSKWYQFWKKAMYKIDYEGMKNKKSGQGDIEFVKIKLWAYPFIWSFKLFMFIMWAIPVWGDKAFILDLKKVMK